MTTSGGEYVAPTPVVKSEQESIGRNDPCWCGSGKKYKRCHGQ
jgi:preprotein translocase subunit SecA